MEKEAEAKNKVKKEKLPKFEKNISLVDEVDFYHGQQYFVAVFKAIRFDLSKQRETKPKKPVDAATAASGTAPLFSPHLPTKATSTAARTGSSASANNDGAAILKILLSSDSVGWGAAWTMP